MVTMSSVQGQCFCKAIRFEIQFPTDFCSHCHCESCRTSHGSAFVTWGGVARNQFQFLSGENKLKKYKSSPKVNWCFCSECGTSLLYIHDEYPEKIYFTVANLTRPLDRGPDSHVSFEERVDWFHTHDQLPKFRAKSDERM
jgi:hypothetical protein